MILSLGGFGLTLRALEARFGRLSLFEYHGLYEHSPTLAVCFLLTGLAAVGFPGTLGFISTELLVDSAVEASPYVGIVVIAAAAMNGIAVMRAYFLLFTGARHASTVSLGIVLRERVAVLSLSALILGGGLFPQLGVATRRRAAEAILEDRRQRLRLEKETVPLEKDLPGRRSTDLRMPKTPDQMVVHQSGRLHQSIADRRSDKREAATFQLFGERIGNLGARWDLRE